MDAVPPFALDERFKTAVDIVQTLPKHGPFPPSIPEQLTMYAYFKQATDGPPASGSRPFWNLKERYKWDAWQMLGCLTCEEAKGLYVEALQEKIDYLQDRPDWNEAISDHLEENPGLEESLRDKFAVIDRDLFVVEGEVRQRTPPRPFPLVCYFASPRPLPK